jgi:hypothetical protein
MVGFQQGSINRANQQAIGKNSLASVYLHIEITLLAIKAYESDQERC